MAALATAFGCVWIAVSVYVGWLGRNQRRLSSRLEELAANIAQVRKEKPSARKAA